MTTLEMDLLTGGLLVIVVAISFGVVIFVITKSSMKEKSYDEVKAEQKKKAEEYFAQGRSTKEKAKDKKLKKAGKKVKEKLSTESVEISSEAVESIKGQVGYLEQGVDKEFNMREDEGVNSTESLNFNQNQSSNKQSKTQTNTSRETKLEKSHTQKQMHQSQKVPERIVNLDKPSEKLQTKSQEKPEKNQIQKKPVEEVITKSSTKHIQNTSYNSTIENTSPSTKSSRKKRSELSTLQQMSGEREAVNVNLLMPLVHKAELSRTEIQVLIDVLLNKQQGSSVDSAEWIEGRQDPVVKLKKQLAEKEKALTEEQDVAAALQIKLRDLRSELNAEKHSTRQLEESLQLRQTELGTLSGRMQLLADDKQALMQQIQQLQSKLNEEHMLLCKVQEDQGQTQSAMQQELLTQRQQLEMHIARLTEQHQETIAALESQIGQMASQLQEQEAVNSSLSGELALVRERGVHLQDSAAQSQDLARQVKELHSEIERLVSKTQYDTNQLQNEISSLTDQLNFKRTESDKLNSLVQNLQVENNRLTHKISSACVEAQQLRNEKESLAAQVTASMERPATEGRENGDLVYSEGKHIDTNIEKIGEKHVLIEQLKNDIVSKEREINLYKSDLLRNESIIRSLNDDLSKAQLNIEKLHEEVSSYKCIVEDQESVINALREEGDSAHKLVTTLREDVGKNKAELVRLSKDCATREQLESKENTIEKLTSELNTHKTKLADQGALIQSLQKEIENYKSNLENNTKCDKLIKELNLCMTELVEKEATLKSLALQKTNYEEDIKQLKNELIANQEKVNKLSQKLEEAVDRQTNLSQDLETQKRKNDELRTKNWKVMDALKVTEKSLETKVKESQRLVSDAEDNAKLKEQERTRQLLRRIQPQITIDDKQEYESWLEQFMMCCHESTSSSHNDATMLAEVEQQNCQLQAMVTHYKAIIADTEGMLNRLQSHVEQEEGRWGQQIQTLESQLEAVIEERDKLEENSELAAQLEEALIKNKELSRELTRLQSLVNIGEKSVSDQMKETSLLKEQIEALQASTKNGPSTVDTGSQTLHKRRNLTGWLRHKLRSRSRSRRSQRSHSRNGHQSA